MTDQKRSRPASISSKASLSSLSDTVIRAGRKAKQKAIKTVKAFTALIKKPRKAQVILDSECKFSLHIICITMIYLFNFA
jgi:hypothetical protein